MAQKRDFYCDRALGSENKRHILKIRSQVEIFRVLKKTEKVQEWVIFYVMLQCFQTLAIKKLLLHVNSFEFFHTVALMARASWKNKFILGHIIQCFLRFFQDLHTHTHL